MIRVLRRPDLLLAPALVLLAAEGRADEYEPLIGPAYGMSGSEETAPAVRVGADFTATFPLGSTSDVANPSLLGGLSAHYMTLSRRLAVGAAASYQVSDFIPVGAPEVELRTILVGPSLRYEIPLWPWATRPFVGLDFGWARFKADGATFNPPKDESSSGGMFVIPRVGIRAIFGRLGVMASAHYQYLRAAHSLEIAESRAKVFPGMGVGFGMFAGF